MNIGTLDLVIIFSFLAIILIVGIAVSRKSNQSASDYFLSGKSMPWWLLGLSMVATTFSTDTPNLVTNIVREDGVAGNWQWWAFLLTGLLTVFVYSKLWRRSNVDTDLGFYELRYSGKSAKFLRGFRSIYLGLIFNILAMATVSLAAIKIGQVMFGLEDWVIVGGASLITVIFSAVGGFRGVVYTDAILFVVAMVGTFGAAYYCVNLPEVGGITNLINHPNVIEKINFIPSFEDPELLITLFIIPLAVQWWSAWYPGAEPGGGGYIAQRMLAAKNETHAIGATFFFNIMHYAVRPWPWIVVALASLIVYPDLASIQHAFPNVSPDKLGHDLAYSAMLTKLPTGLLGLVLAALTAAYMSTISTHLNWGASYIVNDFYLQSVNKKATQKQLVGVGRLATVALMILSALLSLVLENAYEIFRYVLMFGAGTGLIFILRWFWWRINAWSEISAMFSSGIISILFNIDSIHSYLFGYKLPSGDRIVGVLPYWSEFTMVVVITTIVWVTVTYLTKPDSDEKLIQFYKKIQPGGKGWKYIIDKADKQGVQIVDQNRKNNIPEGVVATVIGCVLVYSAMFAIGSLVYGNYIHMTLMFILFLISSYVLIRLWNKIKGIIDT